MCQKIYLWTALCFMENGERMFDTALRQAHNEDDCGCCAAGNVI